MKVFLCFVAVIHVVSSIKNKKCPHFEPMQNFDLSKFLGTWHTQYAIVLPVNSKGETCIKLTFGRSSSGNGFNYTANAYKDGQPITMSAGKVSQPGSDGTLTMTIYEYGDEITGDVYVLATDYDNYTLYYTCYVNPAKPPKYPDAEVVEILDVLTREKTLTPEVQQLAENAVAAVARQGTPPFSALTRTSHDNCA